MFWISFALYAIVFLPMICIILFYPTTWKTRFIGIAIVLILWIFIAFGVLADAKTDIKVWNNGYCECGTHWELRGASKSHYGYETKYYVCPNCHAEIEQ